MSILSPLLQQRLLMLICQMECTLGKFKETIHRMIVSYIVCICKILENLQKNPLPRLLILRSREVRSRVLSP